MAKTRPDLNILNMEVYFCYVSKNIFIAFSTWDRNYTQSNKINIDSIMLNQGWQSTDSQDTFDQPLKVNDLSPNKISSILMIHLLTIITKKRFIFYDTSQLIFSLLSKNLSQPKAIFFHIREDQKKFLEIHFQKYIFSL